MNIPEELHYTKEHEWVRIEDNTATIGITDFAQSELGDIVYLDIDTLGNELDYNEVFGVIEAVKVASDLYMPIAGTVIEANEALDNNEALINQDPYEEGWMIKVRIADDADRSHLLSAADYAAHTEQIKNG